MKRELEQNKVRRARSMGETQKARNIVKRCTDSGFRMTEQRKIVAEILDVSFDHPHVEELFSRVQKKDPKISLATVYRTVKLLEEAGIVEKLEFRDGKARYEDADREHHDHLIDVQTGEIIEFIDRDIEMLQEKIAARYGYKLLGHRLELYGKKHK